MQLPKISNVCSLQSYPKSDPHWTKEINADLIDDLDDSVTISLVPVNSINKEIAEPELVSKTVPVAQATAGDFLITQTISTKYTNDGFSNGLVDFNISIAPTNAVTLTPISTVSTIDKQQQQKDSEITNSEVDLEFKCTGNGCKFITLHSAAMIDHLKIHQTLNSINLDYMHCSYCGYVANDINEYVAHIQSNHKVTSQKKLTEQIQSILKSVPNTNQPSILIEKSAEKTYAQELEETVKEMVKPTGVPDDKLYRCVMPDCRLNLTEETFHSHLLYHASNTSTTPNNNQRLKCPHCTAVYKGLSGMKAHIQNHATHRILCYLCMQTALSPTMFQKHFTEQHWATMNAYTFPLLQNENGVELAFVGHAEMLTENEILAFGKKLIIDWKRRKVAGKTHFKQSEIDLLPVDQILKTEIYCASCYYKTKVRSNMLRHLQFGKCTKPSDVPVADPINPVPCLNKTERHFDKMANLAGSSSSTNTNTKSSNIIPKAKYDYVPRATIFTCGVNDCKYLSVSEDLFRTHLSALHSNVSIYKCPFCHEELCKRTILIDRIIMHLRYHNQKLYQCEECEHVHYSKICMERHISEKHHAVRVHMITYDRTDGETKTTKVALGTGSKSKYGTNVNKTTNSNGASKIENNKQKSKFQWICNLCQHTCFHYQQMSSHSLLMHGCRYTLQCLYCKFGAQQQSQINLHIDSKHKGKPHGGIKLYQKSLILEDVNDTKPLWQRNDPKRVRHIRGILMENEEEAAQYQKKLRLESAFDDSSSSGSGSGSSASAIQIETNNSAATAIAESTTITAYAAVAEKLFLGTYEFACKYCEYISNFDDLHHHWINQHCLPADEPPLFLWNLVNYLKCPLCKNFFGTYKDIEAHFKIAHKRRTLIAADPEAAQLKCGLCATELTNTKTLQKHFIRVDHNIKDLRDITEDTMEKLLKLGENVSYYQCKLCPDIFQNENAVLRHLKTAHVSLDNTAYTKLGSVSLYCCTDCNFISDSEKKTLDHMLNHFPMFKTCHFCELPQSSFIGYMQHCYSKHREDIKKFVHIYPYRSVKKHFCQMTILFPNGLEIAQKYLHLTTYGKENELKAFYAYMNKTSIEPPIPRLSIANLVARKSIEAKQTCSKSTIPNAADNFITPMQLSSKSTAVAMQLADTSKMSTHIKQQAKILKRRSTIALETNETFNNEQFNFPAPLPICKKRKTTYNLPAVPAVPAASFKALEPSTLTPYSFYGHKPEKEDLSKLYATVGICEVYRKLSLDKLKLVYNLNARVVVDKLDINSLTTKVTNNVELCSSSQPTYDDSASYAHINKACPRSEKYKYEWQLPDSE